MDKGLVEGILNAISDMEETISKLGDAVQSFEHEIIELSSQLDAIVVNMDELMEDDGIAIDAEWTNG